MDSESRPLWEKVQHQQMTGVQGSYDTEKRRHRNGWEELELCGGGMGGSYHQLIPMCVWE